MDLKGPEFRIRDNKKEHGVDLTALRTQMDKLRSIPQLKAGLNGRLSRVAEEPKAMTPEQQTEAQIKALAQCVAVAEGDWIAHTLRKIFREDGIGMSFNRRLRMFKDGNLEPMRTMLSELEIEINHQHPEEGYVIPEDCILYRRLEIKKGGKVRGERVWEWSRQA